MCSLSIYSRLFVFSCRKVVMQALDLSLSSMHKCDFRPNTPCVQLGEMLTQAEAYSFCLQQK